MKYLLIACLLGVTAISSSTATAAVLIDIEDATITAGGMQFVDVLITSDANDNLDFFNYEVTITSLGGASDLEFEVPQDLSEEFDPGYVFFGDSFDLFSIDAATVVEASDLSDSGAGVGLDGTPRLLARLDLQHILGGGQTAAMAAGEQFMISLTNDPGITFFDNDVGDPIAIDPNTFATGFGIVTVAAVAVPEPSSLMLCGLILVPAFRRRCKK